MSKKSHHAVHNSNGGWDIKKGGAELASGHFEHKVDAVDAGREISRSVSAEGINYMANEDALKNWVLVCQGGGGKGAWEAGFIYEVSNQCKLDFKTCIGTSVGALNCALYLQSKASPLYANILKDIWERVSSWDILRCPSLIGFGRFGLLDSSKLHDLIVQHVRKNDIKDVCCNQNKYLVILATNFHSLRKWVWHPFIFGPNTSSMTARDSVSCLHAALVASASIPIVFPYTQQNMMALYDGGLVDNNPLRYGEVGCSNVLVLSPNYEDVEISIFRKMWKLVNPLQFLDNQVLKRVAEVKKNIDFRKERSNECFGAIPVTKYYFVRPSRSLASGTIMFSEKNSRDSFNLGRQDAEVFMKSLLANSVDLDRFDLSKITFKSVAPNIWEWIYSGLIKVN